MTVKKPQTLRLVDAPLRELPAYPLRRAAQILRVPASTLRLWSRGEREQKPLFPAAEQAPLVLSFENLVEAFVLSSMRRVHHLSMQKVRKRLDTVGKKLGYARPLLHARFRTDGLDLFVEHADRVLDLGADGQAVLRDVLDASLRRIEWEDDLAARLYPWVRSGQQAAEPRSIVIDPRFGGGQPVIAGTGIEARIVAQRYRAGESIVLLSRDYGVGTELIEDAIRCETREAA